MAAAPQIGDVAELINVSALLTEEERAIQSTIRRFLDERYRPFIGGGFEAGRFPRELIGELASLGVFGMSLEGYGCAGLNATSYGVACLELEAADSGLRSFVSVQGSLVMTAISLFGSEEQKDEWLPRLQRGEALGCF